jgi:hypothetical protein
LNWDQSWLTFADMSLTGWSQPISSGGGQDYDFSARVAGSIAAQGGSIDVHYSDGSSYNLWHNSGSYHSPGGTTHNSTFAVPETADSFQLAYRVNLDQGWLAYSEPILTGWSAWVSGTPGQAYDFSAQVAGLTESYGGRIHVHYDNGDGKTMWHTDNGSYNSPGGTVQENEFTLPTNANQFRFSYRVRLDKGWLAFSDLKLTGWSDTIPVTGGEQYELSLHLAGQLQAPVGQGGQIMVHYPGSSADPVALWVNPANFNNSGTIFSQPFTPPASANSIQFSYEVTMDKGRLAFSDAALNHLNPAYTITRKTYALGGQTIATRISGNQEGENGLFYIHSDHASTLLSTGLGSTSVMSYGQGHGSNSGNKVLDSTARYLPFGDWRVEPAHDTSAGSAQALTVQAFTGQKHNMDLGLYYYNARFYLPYINQHPFHHQARMSGVFVDVANFVGQDVILSRQISDLPYNNFLTEDAGPAIS